jgi:O-antigen ligase
LNRDPSEDATAWWSLAALAAVGLGGALCNLPETVAAVLLLVLFGAAAAWHPAAGLAAVIVAAPFSLGEHKNPYFWIPHLVAGGTVLSALARRGHARRWPAPPYGVLALGVLAAAFLAVPLNLRDLLEDLWLLPALDGARLLREGVPDISHLKYVERIGVLTLGLGLFVVAAQPRFGAAVRGSLLPLAVVAGGIAAFGLLRLVGVIKTGGTYLTLSFLPWQHPERRLTGVAWNPDYLAQWLVLVLPLLLVLLWLESVPWRRWVAGTAAGLAVLALVFTLQRAAYLSAAVAAASLGILLWRAGQEQLRAWGHVGAGLALVVGLAALIDAVVVGGAVAGRVGRLLSDPNRVRLWSAALRMAMDHPVLGIGTGRYAFFFHEYDAAALRAGFGPFWGTAHSLYLHLLAEQGVVGLATFGVFFGALWLGTWRRLRELPAESALLACGLLAALAGWLVYGLVQFTFRVAALVYFVFILAGAAVALTPADRPARAPRGALAVAVAVSLALLAWRIETSLARPVSPGYEAGFYRWERQPDGSAARWTRSRAAMSVPAQGRVLELRLRAPLAGIETRPQTVRVWVDRRQPLRIRLDRAAWRTVTIPVSAPPGQPVLVELEVSHTVVPARLGGSRDDRRLGVMVGTPVWRDA